MAIFVQQMDVCVHFLQYSGLPPMDVYVQKKFYLRDQAGKNDEDHTLLQDEKITQYQYVTNGMGAVTMQRIVIPYLSLIHI